MAIVLDASALLTALRGEPGAERVQASLDGAVMSTVNLAEVAGHYARAGARREDIADLLAGLPIIFAEPDEALAIDAGVMRRLTDRAGLSLGDRFCLALAKRSGARALTADRAWKALGAILGVEVELIR
ncbi:MAG TPA: type II toxin-antitoxin system VapC family toxin [Caulobacteraceae bacterium]